MVRGQEQILAAPVQEQSEEYVGNGGRLTDEQRAFGLGPHGQPWDEIWFHRPRTAVPPVGHVEWKVTIIVNGTGKVENTDEKRTQRAEEVVKTEPCGYEIIRHRRHIFQPTSNGLSTEDALQSPDRNE